MENPERRHPFRLIVQKDAQLRILRLVWGAVIFSMAVAGALVHWSSAWLWSGVLMLAIGTFVAVWVSRRIAGPLYRIEKDLEAVLGGSFEAKEIRLREGDPLQHLAALVNQLRERSQMIPSRHPRGSGGPET